MAGIVRGKLVIAGGSYWQGNRKEWTAQVDVFDPLSNVWNSAVALPEPRSDAACATLDDALFIFGGWAGDIARRDAMVFRGGQWHPLPDAALPAPRVFSTAVVSGSSIYLACGLSRAGDYLSATNTLWVWNSKLRKNGWKVLPPLPGPGRLAHAVVELDGKIYVFGGATGQGTSVRNLDDAYQFDIKTKKWARLPTLPFTVEAWWAVAVHGRILLLGGLQGQDNNFTTSIYQFDPQSKALRKVGALPHALCDSKFFLLGNNLIGAGGEAGFHVRAPWTLETSLPSAFWAPPPLSGGDQGIEHFNSARQAQE
jgi:N-acetylneuraminic acid mutarotase